ncbi:SARP family transcriptional regulator [Embleya hyalina]|uniref:SARP family transcriptional regulator n=2 Tax=Embleya hyalina TaxID=516124 RepID=A0A401YYH9_9ACTN|nr:SARP family transcriptional regulator [Embleya hyalina]
MARPERPIEGEGPVPDFARRLREIRRHAGTPQYRVLAERAHYSAAALSQAASGRKLPGWTLAWAFVRACDETQDEATWRAHWDTARSTASPDPVPHGKQLQPIEPPQPSAPTVGLATEPVEAPLTDLKFDELLAAARATGQREEATQLFVHAMRVRRAAAGNPSFRELSVRSQRADRHPRVPFLARSTLSDALSGKRLPSSEVVMAFALACGAGSRELQDWRRTWTHLSLLDVFPPRVPQGPPAAEAPFSMAEVVIHDATDRWSSRFLVEGPMLLAMSTLLVAFLPSLLDVPLPSSWKSVLPVVLSGVAMSLALLYSVGRSRGRTTTPEKSARRLAVRVYHHEKKALRRALDGDHNMLNLRLEHDPRLGPAYLGPPLPGSSRDIDSFFTRIKSSRLIILGAPGAGKTVMARELATRLLTRTPDGPVPVVLHPARKPDGHSLQRWLRDELIAVHHFSKHEADQLAGSRLILPVLDGIDEMSSLESMKELLDDLRSSFPGAVITCRTQRFHQLARTLGPSRGGYAVVKLDRPHRREVHKYLSHRVRDRERWQPVLSLLRTEPSNSSLETPFIRAMTNPGYLVAATTHYEQLSPDGDYVHDIADLITSHSQAPPLLFLLKHAFAQAPTHPAYPSEDALRWLGTLARHARPNARFSTRTLPLRLRWFLPLRLHRFLEWATETGVLRACGPTHFRFSGMGTQALLAMFPGPDDRSGPRARATEAHEDHHLARRIPRTSHPG